VKKLDGSSMVIMCSPFAVILSACGERVTYRNG